MKIAELLNEAHAPENTVVVGWGRGMGHKGHMYLASAVIEYADKIEATPLFFVSETVGADDPLTPQEKLSIYKTVFPQDAGIFHSAKTIVPTLVQVQENGHYDNLVFIVGEDQKASFQFLAGKTKAGQPVLPYKKVTVMSRQETQTSSSNLEGPRATPMRDVLKDPKATAKQKYAVWRDAMPDALSDDQVKRLMILVAQRLGA